MDIRLLIQKYQENDREFLRELSLEERFFPVLELYEKIYKILILLNLMNI